MRPVNTHPQPITRAGSRHHRIRLAAVVAALGLLGACATKNTPPTANASPPDATTQAAAGPQTPTLPKPRLSPLHYLSPFYWTHRLTAKKPGPPQAEPPQLVGTIRMVNTEDRFVLIDGLSYQDLQPGDLLVCISNQHETANLRMGSLSRPPFLIADIASGTPSVGDRVFKR